MHRLPGYDMNEKNYNKIGARKQNIVIASIRRESESPYLFDVWRFFRRLINDF